MEPVYRVKTKEEFIMEFGTDWRIHDPGNKWTEAMDVYFGMVIDEDFRETPHEGKKSYTHKKLPAYILEGEITLLGTPRYLMKACSCLKGCDKCYHTGTITTIVAENDNKPTEF
jgi:hypothetical protein